MKREDIYIRDPYVLVHNGKYYLYGTKMREPERAFEVYVSTDLDNWSDPMVVFEPDKHFWSSLDYWAPEVHEYRGCFYMLATFRSETRLRGTQILKACSPLGPFVPISDGPVTPANWYSLDGTLYVDKKDTPWMIFCHEWVQIKDGTVCAQQLSKDLTSAVGAPVILYHGSEASWCKPFDDNYITDGPCVIETRSGTLLMLWSSVCESGYCMACARSVSGNIVGPWIQDEEPLFSMDGGHGMLFYSLEGQPYLTLHTPNEAPLERPVWLKVTITEDNIFLSR